MNEEIKKVLDWHNKFGVNVEHSPTIPDEKRCKLRLDIMQEEIDEFKQSYENNDIIEVADALADMQYVLYGTAIEFGLQYHFEKIFNEVHKSNMSKLDENGKPIIREDGKILKSSLFIKPDIKSILKNG